MKSALVHYWLVGKRGGEIVLEAMGEVLPQADLVAHVIKPDSLFGSLRDRTLIRTFISRLPMAERRYQVYLALMPLALEMLDLNSYDLILSSEAGPAKWVIPGPNARHICYCHSPLRYIWDQREIYFGQLPAPLRPFAHAMASSLRRSDALSAHRVDQFIANSTFVRNRIWKYYRREAEVIHPPIDVKQYTVGDGGDYYLIAGEHRRYKRMDLAIKACTALGRRLIVAGGDSNAKELTAVAGPTVEFVGRPDDAAFRKLLAGCRALLFPGPEDFGIVAVEAMASGRPVIALAQGGALDSVDPGVSGLLYHGTEVEDVKSAILEFEANESAFTPSACVAQAMKFDRGLFLQKLRAVVQSPG
jgi:glycosyltransferase involved in cell wall biosynthesis